MPRPDIANTLIRMFIEECFAPGRGSATAGEIYEAFEAWWHASSPGVRIPSQRTLGLALTQAGIGKHKAKGRIVYEATLVEPALAA
jgi:hypothetical protein